MTALDAMTPEQLAALPKELREHIGRVDTVGLALTEFVNAQQVSAPVMLDALFNVYINTVMANDMKAQVGPALARLGIQWSLEAGRFEVVPPASQRH